MKNILFLLIFLSGLTIYGQTHTRKTRSDKGGTHKHSLGYNVKKATKSSSSTKSSSKKSSTTTKRRKK